MNENEKNVRKMTEDFPFDMEEERLNVLDEAHKIIYGDREKTYGKPSKNLEVIATMWNAYLNSRMNIQQNDYENDLNAKDVAVMMILLKAARLGNTPGHRDSVVDICGYAALIERCDE